MSSKLFKAICPTVGLLLAGVLACPGQESVSITTVEVTEANEFRISLTGPAGELVVECSEDLATWAPLVPLGSTGEAVDVTDPVAGSTKYYRVFSFPDSDDSHLNGPIAKALRTTVVYGDLQTVFGLGAGPPATPISLVRDLPTAERDSRVYAATIGLLCVLAQDMIDLIEPAPSEADVVVALAEDLASGSLNGRNSGGSLIEIGSSGNFLPEYTDQDLIAASSQLGEELSGLRNVLLQAVGGGSFTPVAPGDWNTFYWDTADWQ